jgi:phosphoribosyl-ATP pyrophosphohydrolase
MDLFYTASAVPAAQGFHQASQRLAATAQQHQQMEQQVRRLLGEAVPATLLDELEAVIDGRLAQRPEDSYVAKLAAAGVARAAQKVGEEGVETALAAVTRDDDGLAEEAADLLFHLLVLLRIRGLSLQDLLAKLAARRR